MNIKWEKFFIWWLRKHFEIIIFSFEFALRLVLAKSFAINHSRTALALWFFCQVERGYPINIYINFQLVVIQLISAPIKETVIFGTKMSKISKREVEREIEREWDSVCVCFLITLGDFWLLSKAFALCWSIWVSQNHRIHTLFIGLEWNLALSTYNIVWNRIYPELKSQRMARICMYE